MSKPLLKRLALAAAALALAVLLGRLFHEQLTLAGMQTLVRDLDAFRQDSPLVAAAAYFGAYVTITALSVPGAVLLTLAGGALFGTGWGLLMVSFASSLGALLAFLVARYLFRDAVQDRFGERLAAVNEGFRREGAAYLLTLRLVPVFPFFLVNLLLALTPMRAATFYAVSQIGMLPATLVYVNAGTQLARIDILGWIMSPALLGSFALLGLFPPLASRLVSRWRRRRVYARWQRPKRFDRNLVVIGAGAAGLVSAYIAAAVRAKVTLVESHRMGGDCLNTGCVPSKALIRSARLAAQIREAAALGLPVVEPRIAFGAVMARVREVIARIEPHDSVARYTGLGVEVLQGHARIRDPWTVEIRGEGGNTTTLSTRAIVIATGARPVIPEIPGIGNADCQSSETLWDWLSSREEAPARTVVLGGGSIGVELAQALSRLGSQVTVVESAARLLGREDADAAAAIEAALRASGVELLCGHRAIACHAGAEGRSLEIEGGSGTRHLPYELLICAVGRVPRLEGFGLEELGIPCSATLDTDQYLATLYPNIHAAGDVAGPFRLTHAAAHQAWYAAVNALFGDLRRFAVDYRVIPRVTFCDPELASVGITEDEARAKGIAVELTRYDLDELDRAIADGAARGFVKVLTPPGSDRILGVTIVGEHAGELIAEFALAMRWKLGLGKILSTVHAYPTWSEAAKYVAGEWRRAHAPQRALAWLARYHAWRRGG
ncbi:MAG: FAD-dependent oxidoreductase [Gammaproteobacteria bacterium]